MNYIALQYLEMGYNMNELPKLFERDFKIKINSSQHNTMLEHIVNNVSKEELDAFQKGQAPRSKSKPKVKSDDYLKIEEENFKNNRVKDKPGLGGVGPTWLLIGENKEADAPAPQPENTATKFFEEIDNKLKKGTA